MRNELKNKLKGTKDNSNGRIKNIWIQGEEVKPGLFKIIVEYGQDDYKENVEQYGKIGKAVEELGLEDEECSFRYTDLGEFKSVYYEDEEEELEEDLAELLEGAEEV